MAFLSEDFKLRLNNQMVQLYHIRQAIQAALTNQNLPIKPFSIVRRRERV